MNSIIRRSIISLRLLLAVVFFLVVITLLALSKVALADNGKSPQSGRLITIHDRGVEKVILSNATTIGDAIDEAGIAVEKNDFVEPALTQELVASDYQVNIYRARPVVVVDGSVKVKIVTPYQTAEQIANSVGITLYPEDKTTIGVADSLEYGVSLQMTIKRATPFTFTLYGNTSTVRTQATTVGQMLTEKGIRLGKDDRTIPASDAILSAGMTVKVWREGKQTITVDEPVAFSVEQIENADLDASYRSIRSAGTAGSRSVTYEVIVVNGQESSRTEIASLTTKQPIKQVEVIGVKGKYTTPSENETIVWNYLIANGYSRVQAAGIMGNLMQEHHFLTSGDGLAQWTGSRRAELYSLPAPNNIYTQVGFLVHELSTNYASVGSAIKSSGSLTEVVQIFQNRFEKCGICRESNRIQYARDILASH
ncbi:DUF348 domain-containing protein [Candidatus Saccharibacteria bacterium]|nr:DUF348 domain-containing protein [Candidatus Saccharibacteria bacterium]